MRYYALFNFTVYDYRIIFLNAVDAETHTCIQPMQAVHRIIPLFGSNLIPIVGDHWNLLNVPPNHLVTSAYQMGERNTI